MIFTYVSLRNSMFLKGFKTSTNHKIMAEYTREEFSDFANKIIAIEKMRGLSDWKMKKEFEKEEPNDDIVDRQLDTVQNCVKKINAFFKYAEDKGCKWAEFISLYSRKQKKEAEIDPNQDKIAASLKRIAEKKLQASKKKAADKDAKKATKFGYSKHDLETRPVKNESDEE